MSNIEEIGRVAAFAALRKAEELDEENVLKAAFMGICDARDAIAKMTVLVAVFGEEGLETIAEALMKRDMAETVEQAEDVLKDSDE